MTRGARVLKSGRERTLPRGAAVGPNFSSAGSGRTTALRLVHLPQRAFQPAHALKGSCGLFSSAGAYESAQRLEKLAREGVLDEIDAARDELTLEVRRLERALREMDET